MHYEKLRQPFEVTKKRNRTLLFLFSVILYLTYFIRGFRPIWWYGYFNYTINWTHGFMPRGLWGTVLRLLCGNHVPSAHLLALLQYGIGVAFAAYICVVLYRLINNAGNLTAAFFFAVFSVSTFNMFYMTEVGFLDHIIYLLVILHMEIALRAGWKKTLVAGAILSAIIPWILETGAFLMCPIVASICAIRMLEEKSLGIKGIIVRLSAAFIPTVVGIVIYRHMPVSQSAADIFYQEMQNKAFYDDSFAAYSKIFGTDINLGNITPKCWVYIPPEVVVYAALFIGILSLFVMNTGCSVRTMGFTIFLLITTSFVSYLAIYFGSDYHRYYFSMGQAPMMIGLFLFQRHRSENLTKLQGIFMVTAGLLVLLPVLNYRIWAWNGSYNELWFVNLFKKTGYMG